MRVLLSGGMKRLDRSTVTSRSDIFCIFFAYIFVLTMPLSASAATRDVQLSALTVTPTTSVPMGVLTTTFLVRNEGDAPSGRLRTVVSIWPYQKLLDHVSDAIAAGESKTIGPLEVQLPPDLLSGMYKLEACVVGFDSFVPDSDTGNNCRTLPLIINSPNTVDLTIVEVTSVTTIAPETKFTVTSTLKNSGNTSLDGLRPGVILSAASVYLSTDPVITRNDMHLGNAYFVNKDEQGRDVLRADVLIWKSLSPGFYFLGACADAEDLVVETDEMNNCSGGVSLQVLSYDGTTDLRVVLINRDTLAAYADESYRVLFEIDNAGPAAAGPFNISASWRLNQPGSTIVQLAPTRISGIPAASSLKVGSLLVHIPSDSKPGRYVLTLCVDSANEVLERIETNNCKDDFDFVVEGRRDVEVDNLSLNVSNVTPGGYVNMTYTIKSIAYPLATEVGPTVLWSADSIITREDSEVRASLSGLNQYITEQSRTQPIQVPWNASPGSYFMALCMDWLDFIPELEENNNCRVVQVNVLPAEAPSSAAPDIRRVLTNATSAAPGSVVQVVIDVFNPGKSPIPPFSTRLYLSYQPCNDCRFQEALKLVESPEIPPLTARTLGPIDLRIPDGTGSGSRFLVACIYIDCGYVPIVIVVGPPSRDLRSDLPGVPTEVAVGQSIGLSVRTNNFGSAPVEMNTSSSIRLSYDAKITADDRELASVLAGYVSPDNLSTENRVSISIPADISPGSYYIGVCADFTDIVLETDEANNCLAYPIQITAQRLRKVTDIAVQAVSVEAPIINEGDYVWISFSVQNAGTDFEEVPIRNSIVWSWDNTIETSDRELAGISTPVPAPGGSKRISLPVQMPRGIVSGTYYLGVCSELPDANLTNSCSSVAISVVSGHAVALDILNVVASARGVYSGDDLDLSFQVLNNGNTVSSEYVMLLRWSVDADLSEDDLVLRRLAGININPRETQALVPFRTRIPHVVPAGTYNVGVCIVAAFQIPKCEWVPIQVRTQERQTTSIALKPQTMGAEATLGTGGALSTGFAMLDANSGPVPYGTALLSSTQNGFLITETAVPASPPTRAATIFIELRTEVPNSGGVVSVNTGFALANPGRSEAAVTLVLLDVNGEPLARGTTTLPPTKHIAAYVDQIQALTSTFVLPPDFAENKRFGTLQISSPEPISVVALRLVVNQRGETLITTTARADRAAALSYNPLVFPHFAAGRGYTYQVVLVNTSDNVESGEVRFWTNDTVPARIDFTDGVSASSREYNIPAGGAAVFEVADTSPQLGWVEVFPTANSPAPIGAAVIRFSRAGVAVTETAISPSESMAQSLFYVDESAGHKTAFAILNPLETERVVRTTLLDKSGLAIATKQWMLPPRATSSRFVAETFESIPPEFTGLMRIEVEAPFPGVNVMALHTITNERGDFLFATLPVANVDRPSPGPVVFPHIADGAGYKTEIILINSDTRANSSSILRFIHDKDGQFPLSH